MFGESLCRIIKNTSKVLLLEVAELQINPPTNDIVFYPEFIANYSKALGNNRKQVEIGKVSTRERRELHWVRSLYGFSPEGKSLKHRMART